MKPNPNQIETAKIAVTRPYDGITLNEFEEILLDEAGNILYFDSVEQAKSYLKSHGVTEEEMVHLKFRKSCGTCRRCGSPLFPSDLPEYAFQCFECDEDFYAFEQDDIHT